jgi:hypothetical protein
MNQKKERERGNSLPQMLWQVVEAYQVVGTFDGKYGFPSILMPLNAFGLAIAKPFATIADKPKVPS